MDDIQRVIKNMGNYIRWGITDAETTISTMQELQQYREIGTPEECREAVERQQTRKPLMSKNTNKLTGNIFICPSCNGIVGIDDEREFYCAGCGQAIDWGDKG